MRSLNLVMLMGHLAADVELRQTKSGIPVANFPVAINRTTRNLTGERRQIADFYRIIVWGGLAGICRQYLVKGMAVFVEGKLVNRSFEDKTGNRHYRTEIISDRVDFLTWKKSKGGEKEVALESISEDDDAYEELAEKDEIAAAVK